jgi:hypothetical protein
MGPTVIAPISREPVEVSRLPQKFSLGGREFTRKHGRPASANPTFAKRPAPNDTTWGPTRLSCVPPRMAVSRLPTAFLQPESCCRSFGVFDLPRALGAWQPEVQHRCAPRSVLAPFWLDSPLHGKKKHPLNAFLTEKNAEMGNHSETTHHSQAGSSLFCVSS